MSCQLAAWGTEFESRRAKAFSITKEKALRARMLGASLHFCFVVYIMLTHITFRAQTLGFVDLSAFCRFVSTKQSFGSALATVQYREFDRASIEGTFKHAKLGFYEVG